MTESRRGPDLGLFADDRGLARDLDEHRRLRLERIWRAERSRLPRHCRACRRSLLWLLTPRGKWMPVDPTPNPAGNVVMERRGCAHVARVASDDLADEEPGTVRWMPHHATCPHAPRFRRR